MAEPPPFIVTPDRPIELPYLPEIAALEGAVERIGYQPARNAGRNAFRHLRKSWILHPIDSEMSYFRALTAVEEAATSVILSLKQQKYPGADRLNARDHVHKAAVWPIIDSIAQGFVEKGVPTPNISISTSGRPRISLDIEIGQIIGSERPFWVNSPDPFHVVIHSDENGPFEVHRWHRELAKLAGEGVDVRKHFFDIANQRNHVLYASQQGIPSIRFKDDFILLRLERVKWMMVATIGILQTKTIQLLVVQALEAMLLAINRFVGEGFEFPEYRRPTGRHLWIEQQPNCSFEAEIAE